MLGSKSCLNRKRPLSQFLLRVLALEGGRSLVMSGKAIIPLEITEFAKTGHAVRGVATNFFFIKIKFSLIQLKQKN